MVDVYPVDIPGLIRRYGQEYEEAAEQKEQRFKKAAQLYSQLKEVYKPGGGYLIGAKRRSLSAARQQQAALGLGASTRPVALAADIERQYEDIRSQRQAQAIAAEAQYLGRYTPLMPPATIADLAVGKYRTETMAELDRWQWEQMRRIADLQAAANVYRYAYPPQSTYARRFWGGGGAEGGGVGGYGGYDGGGGAGGRRVPVSIGSSAGGQKVVLTPEETRGRIIDYLSENNTKALTGYLADLESQGLTVTYGPGGAVDPYYWRDRAVIQSMSADELARNFNVSELAGLYFNDFLDWDDYMATVAVKEAEKWLEEPFEQTEAATTTWFRGPFGTYFPTGKGWENYQGLFGGGGGGRFGGYGYTGSW